MLRKTALVICHVPAEGLAAFRQPIEESGYVINRVFVTDPEFATVDLRDADLLVMMGGPMAVYEADRYPWIQCQLRRLSKRLEADLPTLGVCFGAQMIAAALGSDVYPGPFQEIGFHEVVPNIAGRNSWLRHIENTPVLHWHSDTFDLPEHCELLASSHYYENQAFRRGSNILGLQFHAEMGQDARFYQWLDNWPDDIEAAGTSRADLHNAHEKYGARAVVAGQRMIADWLDGLDAQTFSRTVQFANRRMTPTHPLSGATI